MGSDPGGDLQILLQFQKRMQSQADIQAEVEAAGGVTPLQRCWTHPKPQELRSENSELN